MRLIRPVQEFREARRCVPRARPRTRWHRGKRGGRLMVSRTDRSQFSEWWWTVDRYLLIGLITLMFGGIVLSLAGSPPVAERLGYDSFHFVKRHIAFFFPAVAVLIATSF